MKKILSIFLTVFKIEKKTDPLTSYNGWQVHKVYPYTLITYSFNDKKINPIYDRNITFLK